MSGKDSKNKTDFPVECSSCCFISGPILSPVLLRAVQRQGIPVHVHPPIPPLPDAINILGDAEAASLLQDRNAVVLMNWEGSLPFIFRTLPRERLDQVNLLKDKTAFRELLRKSYPNLFFVELTREELQTFRLPRGVEKVVLKPTVGTASVGIRTVHGQEEWTRAADCVLEEVDRAASSMDSSMVSGLRFLVEEFIDGEEFACDGFWDRTGRTVITCVYQHPLSSDSDVRDVIYYTSKQVMAETLEPATRLMDRLGAQLSLRRFAFHVEFRKSNDGTLVPVELNPLRYGQAALADLAEHAFGFNPYELFFSDEAPDWDSLLAQPDQSKIYAFVLGSLPPDYEIGKYQIDEEGFRNTFGNRLLSYLPSDPAITPFFAVAHMATDRLEDIFKYLYLDFKKFLCLSR